MLFVLGIVFAVVLMCIQLGFRGALLDSQTLVHERINADLVMVSPNRQALAMRETFPRRRLEQAKAIAGVAEVHPLFIDNGFGVLRNTNPDASQRTPSRSIRVIGLDPDAMVLKLPELDPQNPEFLDVKVINFGLGHARTKRGTPYAAPEQQRGSEGDARSDAWALGTLLCEIVSGKPLFLGKPGEVLRQVLGARPGLPPQLPSLAHPVLDALLASEPDRRYHRLSDAVADLDFGREPAFARMGKRLKSIRGSGTPLAIQKYALGKMDIVDLRGKQLQKDLADDARAERRRATTGRTLNAAALVGVFGGLLWRASVLPATFETATVAAVTGKPRASGKTLRSARGSRAGRVRESLPGRVSRSPSRFAAAGCSCRKTRRFRSVPCAGTTPRSAASSWSADG